jgi:hypothetical protein
MGKKKIAAKVDRKGSVTGTRKSTHTTPTGKVKGEK